MKLLQTDEDSRPHPSQISLPHGAVLHQIRSRTIPPVSASGRTAPILISPDAAALFEPEVSAAADEVTEPAANDLLFIKRPPDFKI